MILAESALCAVSSPHRFQNVVSIGKASTKTNIVIAIYGQTIGTLIGENRLSLILLVADILRLAKNLHTIRYFG